MEYFRSRPSFWSGDRVDFHHPVGPFPQVAIWLLPIAKFDVHQGEVVLFTLGDDDKGDELTFTVQFN